jgi:eukaryotic-like serine/threonine-protein kinase
MGEQMRQAFVDFLQAECAAHPLVLVLEDLHWGDPPTIRFVDAALRALHEQPLLVLALARPEVHEALPRLWDGRALVELALTPLTRRASERLAREVLGDSVPAALIKGIVDRADGNAFYLEELIRAASLGKGAALPETVLAMVHARLFGLDPEARRVLRAASVFGQSFCRGGVSALLGGADVEGWLAALAHQEVISVDAGGKFPGEAEYTFRHSLLREAAYGMLTEDDRAVGHRLAGEWLERAGEVDASVLAEHFERGGETTRAAAWYRRAAERAASGRRPGGAVPSRRSSSDWSGKDSSPRSPSKLIGGD